MAVEAGWVLAEHMRRARGAAGTPDWPAALAAYAAVRPPHCRRVVLTARAWGELWHLDGVPREQRNVLLRARAVDDYSFPDWIYGPTALFPDHEPAMFEPVPLATADRIAAGRPGKTSTSCRGNFYNAFDGARDVVEREVPSSGVTVVPSSWTATSFRWAITKRCSKRSSRSRTTRSCAGTRWRDR